MNLFYNEYVVYSLISSCKISQAEQNDSLNINGFNPCDHLKCMKHHWKQWLVCLALLLVFIIDFFTVCGKVWNNTHDNMCECLVNKFYSDSDMQLFYSEPSTYQWYFSPSFRRHLQYEQDQKWEVFNIPSRWLLVISCHFGKLLLDTLE